LEYPLSVFTDWNKAGLADDLAAAIGWARRFAFARVAGFQQRRLGFAVAGFVFSFLRLRARRDRQRANRQQNCESKELFVHKSPR
jgi:hypothetical protein